jgi:hypothetical protein
MRNRYLLLSSVDVEDAKSISSSIQCGGWGCETDIFLYPVWRLRMQNRYLLVSSVAVEDAKPISSSIQCGGWRCKTDNISISIARRRELIRPQVTRSYSLLWERRVKHNIYPSRLYKRYKTLVQNSTKRPPKFVCTTGQQKVGIILVKNEETLWQILAATMLLVW